MERETISVTLSDTFVTIILSSTISDTLIDLQIHTIFSTSMDAQIPMFVEKPLVSCGCKKFKVDSLGDHLSTCTSHSGPKKVHDWSVGQLGDLCGDSIVGTWS
jgi:hypothetical protein